MGIRELFQKKQVRVLALLAAALLFAGAVAVVNTGNGTGGDAAERADVDMDEQGYREPREPRELPDLTGEPGPLAPPPEVSPVDYSPESVSSRVLVELADGVDPAALVAVGDPALGVESGPVAGGKILEVFSSVGNVVVVGLPEGVSQQDATEKLSGFEGVMSAEPDSLVELNSTGSQLNPSGAWGLNRIDQPTLPLDNVYNYRSNGSGVRAYVIDGGLRSDHVEFTGRVAAGYTVISDGLGTEECAEENGGETWGHGTHVAGTIAGTTYGVAKGATVVPIRVFDCAGSGTWAGITSGVNWVVANHPEGTRGVINMSLGGGGNASADAAVEAAIAAGFPVVAAAGNNQIDACYVSPARVPDALTVGASDKNDAKPGFSNIGSCVDLFAPGVDIPSAFPTSAFAVRSWEGTSMAAPHVAGVAVQLLALNPGWTAAQVNDEINNTATPNTVTHVSSSTTKDLLFANPNTSVDTTVGATMLTNATHSFHAVPGTPAVIYKRTYGNPGTIAGSLTLDAGEDAVGAAIMSSDGTTGYFAVAGTPSKIVKVDLANMTRVSDLTLHTSENYVHTGVINTDDTRGYFTTGDTPSKVVTVNLTDMTRVSADALIYADGVPRSAAWVTGANSTNIFVLGTNTSPGKVIQMRPLSTNAMRFDIVLTLESGENDLRSAVLVPNTSTVLFGTNTAPGRVVQVNFGGVPARTGALTLTAGNDYLIAAGMAPDGANAYFSTNTSPGRIISVPVTP